MRHCVNWSRIYARYLSLNDQSWMLENRWLGSALATKTLEIIFVSFNSNMHMHISTWSLRWRLWWWQAFPPHSPHIHGPFFFRESLFMQLSAWQCASLQWIYCKVCLFTFQPFCSSNASSLGFPLDPDSRIGDSEINRRESAIHLSWSSNEDDAVNLKLHM